jgi:putative ABC transport system substrate-binding protein
MDGRPILNKIAALLLIAGLWIMPAGAHAAGAAPRPIAILLSDSQEAYTRPVASFTDEIQMPVKVFNLKGDINNAPAVMDKIRAIRPSLIFALGAKAACTAKVWTSDPPHTPVIFAMVLNWRQYRLTEGQDNIAGIATEVAPGTQLANMTIISPRLKRVGIIYSRAHSLQTVRRVKDAAKKLDLQIIDLSIRRPKEFRQAFKKLSEQIDAYWMLADPVVYTLKNVDWLTQRCAKNHLVCMGQSKNIAEVGVLLAVNPDIANVGRQAASMAKNILLRHQLPERIGVMPPLGTRLVLNAKTAKEIGLKLNHTVMDMANDIIDR